VSSTKRLAQFVPLVNLSTEKNYPDFFRCYNFPDYGIETIGKNRGVSFDYFIGCMGHLGRGLGSTMLKRTIALVSDQIAHPDQSFFIGHQVDNSKAVQCTTRAGFKFERNFVEDGKLSALYSRGS